MKYHFLTFDGRQYRCQDPTHMHPQIEVFIVSNAPHQPNHWRRLPGTGIRYEDVLLVLRKEYDRLTGRNRP